MEEVKKGIRTKPKFRIPNFVDSRGVSQNEATVCVDTPVEISKTSDNSLPTRTTHQTDIQLKKTPLLSNGHVAIHEGKILPTIVVQAPIDKDSTKKEKVQPQCSNIKDLLRNNWKHKLIMTILLFMAGIVAASHCKDYITDFLLVVEKESWITTVAALQLLFILVSFPVSWGFVLLLIASGYLYGVVYGPCIVILLSGPGLVISHLSIQTFFKQCNKVNFTSDYLMGITTLVEGKSGWKIVALMRMTMIPYGIQNGIFALTDISVMKYCAASLVGLFPMAFLNCYFGSTLKSLRQLSSLHQLEASNFIVPTCQVIVTGLIMVFVLRKTKNEIILAMNRIRDNKINNV